MSEQESAQQAFPSLKDNEMLLQVTLPEGCSETKKKFRVCAPNDNRTFEIDIPAGVGSGNVVFVIVNKSSRAEPSFNEKADSSIDAGSDKLLQGSTEQSNLDDAATATVGVVVNEGLISGPIIVGTIVENVVGATNKTNDSNKVSETAPAAPVSTPIMERAGNVVRRMSAGILSYIPVVSGAEAEVVSPDPAAMAALNLRPRTSSFANSTAESAAAGAASSSSPISSSPISDPALFALRQRTRTSSDPVNSTESAAEEVEPRSRSSSIWRYLTGAAEPQSTVPDAAAMAALNLRPRTSSFANPAAEAVADAASYYTADPEASALHQRSRSSSYAVPAAGPVSTSAPAFDETDVSRGSMMESAGNAVRRMGASVLSYVPVISGSEKAADPAAMAALHLRPRTSSFADPATDAALDSISYYTADPEASALHQRTRTTSSEQVAVNASKSNDAEADRGSMMESAGNAVRRMSASVLSYVPVISGSEKAADPAAMAALHLRPRTSSFADPATDAALDSISYYTADPEASALHQRSRTASKEQAAANASASDEAEADRGSMMENAGNVVRRMSASLLSYVPVTSGVETAAAVPDPAAMAALHLRPRTSSFADPATEVPADSASPAQDSSVPATLAP